MVDEGMAKVIATSGKNWGPNATHTEGGVTFYLVGRNASHQFYVGQMGKFFLTYSSGEGWDEDGNDMLSESVRAYRSLDELAAKAYLGHL